MSRTQIVRTGDLTHIDLYQRLTPSNLLVLSPLAFLAAASYAIVNPSASPGLTLVAWIVAFIAGFLLVGIFLPIYAFFAMALRQPLLTVTNDTLVAMRIYLSWYDISRIELQRYWGRPRIFLGVRDPQTFLASLPNYVSRFYSRSFSLTNNCIVVPSVRGHSDGEVVELLQRYWIERRNDQTASRKISYTTSKPSEPAAAFAASIFGFALSMQWLNFIECIQRTRALCAAVPLVYSLAAGIGTYVLTRIILQSIAKVIPGFDLWEKITVLQELVFAGIMPRPRR